ncbi:MAG: PRD domain-containing protein [Treponema sp.]|nr:PRD domain-containing protein [Treponema sp.]
MKIVKVLNNNAVVCMDDDGREKIATGRGLAFGKKAGQELDSSKVSKLFVLNNQETNSRLLKFVEEIPVERFLLAERIIEITKQSCKKELDDSLYITLTDHLNAAFERYENHINVTNPLTGAIQSFYPEEFQLGTKAVQIIKQETGVEFSIDEAAFITMHFVTSELGRNTPEFNTVLTFVNDISCIAAEYLQNEVDESSSSWQRFLTHLSFFAHRIMTGKERPDKNVLLYDPVSRAFPDACKCVDQICDYILQKYAYTVEADEKTYLMIHVNRLQLEFGIKESVK